MIETTEPLSAGWWFNRLLKQLQARQPRLERLDRYYRGDCDLPQGAENCADAYRRFQRKARTNFSELVVEAVRERMQPVGFRTGAAGDDISDSEAWRIWQANSLDADFALISRASLTMSIAYAIVGPVDPDIDAPLITPEDPRQVITAHDPMRRRKVVAALKVFYDDTYGQWRAYVYLPGEVHRAYITGREGQVPSVGSWQWEDIQVLPRLFVPVVEFANRPDLYGSPLGEFESALDTIDRINHMLLQRLMIATTQAFKQRAAKGLPLRDKNGVEIDYSGMFAADGPGVMWQLPPDAEIWESGQVDLAGILQAVRHDVQDLAATTRTPLFYLTPDAANGSAEGASLAREGLLFKCADRIPQASESLEQVMSHAFVFAGDDERARTPDMEVLWAPPQAISVAEKYDAAVKAKAAGVPWRTIMSDVLGFGPQVMKRMEIEQASDALFATPMDQGALVAG